MTEKMCWAIIEGLDWKSDHDYNRINKELKEILTLDAFNQLLDFVLVKAKQFKLKFNDVWISKLEAGEDSWSDICFDVVGRGRDEYEQMTEDRLVEIDYLLLYQESFIYSFQS